MVGSLIYIMTGTRPDLCYIVTKIVRENVKRYLKGTQELGLTLGTSLSPLTLKGFCDSVGEHLLKIDEARQATIFSFHTRWSTDIMEKPKTTDRGIVDM